MDCLTKDIEAPSSLFGAVPTITGLFRHLALTKSLCAVPGHPMGRTVKGELRAAGLPPGDREGASPS